MFNLKSTARKSVGKTYVSTGYLPGYIDPKQPPTKKQPFKAINDISLAQSVRKSRCGTLIVRLMHTKGRAAASRRNTPNFMGSDSAEDRRPELFESPPQSSGSD